MKIGYLDPPHGPILLESFNTEERVRALLAPGDLSSLGRDLGDKHDFNLRPEDTCNYYGRDRGEDDTGKRTYASREAWLKELGQSYNYLFVPGRGWLMAPSREDFAELSAS